jgi:hypothetical protein
MNKNRLSRIQRLSLVATAVVVLAIFISYRESCFAQQNKTSGTAPEVTYKYDTEGVRLEGTLTERTFYGPPGFGETPAKDARDKVLVLKLKLPISVEPTPDAEAKGSESLDPFKHIRDVQLFIPREKNVDARKMLGGTVVAVGTLREAVSPGQHTKVTMDVNTLTQK